MKKWRRVLFMSLLAIIPVCAHTQYIVNEFDAPGSGARGLTWDGTYLWCADAFADSIFKIDPASGQVIHSLFFSRNFSTSRGGGIAWSPDSALWVTHNQYFYKLDASTGEDMTNFHCPGG